MRPIAGHAGIVRALAQAIGPAISGYLLGSVSSADLVSNRRSIDLRTVGDRNPGYWNARAAFGNLAALPVLVGDIAKGAAGAGIGRLFAGAGQWWPPAVGGGAAMVGHSWPLFARFRGGRGVATFVGAAAVVSPVTAALALGVGAVAWAGTNSFARAVQAGFVAYPIAQIAVDGPRRTAATGVLMSFIGWRFATAGRTSDRASAPGA
jgi:acyl phosphate:glycerol-3-phosphate acyltransferase